MLNRITSLFPLWAILISVLAITMPHPLNELKFLIVPGLIVIMFSMGLTLTAQDVKRVLNNPKIILLGVAIQYLFMPLFAWGISVVIGFEKDILIGMVLVGSVSGGTASNVICYLAGADVALSIGMTLFSTLLAFIATPLLTYLYVGQSVPVPVLMMLLSILKIVLIPLTAGFVIRKYLSSSVEKCMKFLPIISMVTILFVIGIVVALNQETIVNMGLFLIMGVMLHNLLGLSTGYFMPKLFGFDKKICRTIAIEVGMQNSGLAVALASKYFSSLAALPGAIFSVWHNIAGSFVASKWSNSSLEKFSKIN